MNKVIQLDGYYKEKIKFTREEIRTSVENDLPLSDTMTDAQMDNVMRSRELEIVRKTREHAHEGKLAEDEEDCYMHHVYEFHGIIWLFLSLTKI